MIEIGKKSPVRRRQHAWETLVLVARESARSMVANQHFDTAAILSYYAFLSLVPMLLLVMVLASQFVLSSPRILEELQGVSIDLFPGLGGALSGEVQRLAGQRIWSVLSVVLLFWSVTPLAAALRGAFTRIFRPARSHSYLRRKLRDILGALTLVALFLLLVAGRIIYGSLSVRFHVEVTWGAALVNLATNVLLAFGGICFFFAVFMPVRLRLVELAGGVAVVTLLLFVLRPAFSWFLQFNPNYGFAFGSLKAVFLLFSWVYLSFVIILYGAEIMAAANRREIILLRPLLNGQMLAHRVHGALVDRFVRRYEAGELVFEFGVEGHEMFYIRSGEVALRRGDVTIRTMKAGEYFGEMSMLLDAPRSTEARSVAEGTELIVIARSNFDTILRENPQIGHAILKEMAERLRETSDRLVAPVA